MTKSVKVVCLLLFLAILGGAAMKLLRPSAEAVEVIDLKPSAVESPSMCAWRDPKHDMALYFPGATGYRTDLVSLSALRPQILARLGPGGRIESHSLYIQRILRGSEAIGSVMVQRASGPHGAIE